MMGLNVTVNSVVIFCSFLWCVFYVCYLVVLSFSGGCI